MDGWPLLDSPLPTLLLTAGYLLLVWLGPRLMRHRQPMQLRAPLVLYNLAVSLLNLYIGLEVGGSGISVGRRLARAGYVPLYVTCRGILYGRESIKHCVARRLFVKGRGPLSFSNFPN